MTFLGDDDETIIDKTPSNGEGYCSGSYTWEELLELPVEWDEVDAEVVECHECIYRRTDQCPMRYRYSSGVIDDFAHDGRFCYKGQRREVK